MKRRLFFGLISSLVFFALMFATACPVFAAYVGDGFCGHMASDIDYKYINKLHCQCYQCGAYRNHKYDTFGFNLLGLDPSKVHRCIYCRMVENHTFGNLGSARCAVADAGEKCTHRIYSINGGAYDANNHICRYCGYIAPHNFGDPNIPVREIKCTCGYACPHSFSAGNADGSTHICSICHFKFIHNLVPKADGSGCVCSDCSYTVPHSFVDQSDGTHKCSSCGYSEAHEWNNIISDQYKHTCFDCARQEKHTFVDGVCSVCGYHCAHTFELATGNCVNCGYNWNSPNNNSTCSLKASHSCAQACTECGLRLPHNFVDQSDGTHKCSSCGLAEAHHYVVSPGIFKSIGDSLQHECRDCGRKENHVYGGDNICDVCGITDAPTITSTTPGDGAVNVPVGTDDLIITFSEMMDTYNNPLTNGMTFSLSPANVRIYAYQWDTSAASSLCRTFIFALPDGLKYDMKYTFTVSGFKDNTDVVNNGGTPMKESSFSFTTEKNSDAALSGLAVSGGTLNPVFDPGTAVYEVNVPNSVTELTVTPTVRGAGATVTVNGNAVASGSTSNNIPLSPGDNPVNVTVTAQDETTTKIYTVWVNRTPDADAALSSLSISQGTLSPAFSSGTYDYSVSVGSNIGSITVTPAASGVGATVTVNGNVVASGTMSAPIALAPGANLVYISIVAQDGKTEEDYTLHVTRAQPPATFVPVTGITGVPTTATAGVNLTLSGTATPVNTTNQNIIWSVQNAGTTGATISGNTLSTTATGTVTIRATITNGLTASTDYTQDFIITMTAAPVTTYTLTAAAGSGGSISPSGAVNVTMGNNQTFTITPGSGHRISSVTVDGVDQGAITTYIFTNITANHTINATFTSTDSRGDGGGNSTPTTSTHNADVTEDGGAISTMPVTVDKDSGSASVKIDSRGAGLSNGENLTVTLPSIPGVSSYSLGVPVAYLTTPGDGSLTFDTDTGSITLPADMLAGISGTEGKKAEITIGRGDKSGLPDSVKAAIGDRPLIQLSLTLDGKQTEWNNPDAPIITSIPYTPAVAELANPEGIVIWYINGSGKAVCIPNGHYDLATGTVTFTTTHFSDYAVAYNKVSFNDVAANAWYNKAVSFIAAREITTGTGNSNFSPEAKLMRGEFIVLMMRAYDISPDTNPTDNFADSGNTYYTGYLAAAKRLGISSGIGNNMYAPEKEITRQEMFTLLYNALKVIGQLPGGDSGKTLSDFTDVEQIDSWAKEAMTLLVKTGTVGGSNRKLTPQGTTTRAEMAQVLYNLLGK